MIGPRVAGLGLLAGLCSAAQLQPYSTKSTERPLSECPGYKVSNIWTSATGLYADLKLAGAPCNTYGTDLEKLRLEVTYETGE
jgi:alpha-glucosidase